MERHFDNNDQGVAFENERRTSEKAPIWLGHIQLSRTSINALIQAAKSGLDPKLDIAIWERQTKAGKNMLSIKISQQRTMSDDQIARTENRQYVARGRAPVPAPTKVITRQNLAPRRPADPSDDWSDEPL